MGTTQLFIWTVIVVNGLAGVAGGLLSERWLSRHLSGLVAFAAGALLAAVFLELVPESLEATGEAAFRWMLASFVALALVEWKLTRAAPEVAGPTRALPSALLGADALHNIGDGAAIAASFLVSDSAGLVTAVAVIAHEVPEEVGDYGLLRAAGYSRARALVALGGVQLTAAMGAAAVLLGSRVFEDLQGVVLAIASGTFLYIAAVDLMPEVRGRGGAGRMTGFLTGMGLVLLLTVLASQAG